MSIGDIENKGYYVDSNGGEKIRIKQIKEDLIAPGIRGIKKIASAMLATTMLFAQTLSDDISGLPHYAGLDIDKWFKKHVKVKVTRVKPKHYGDYTDVYTDDYYERYNYNARKLDNSYYRPRKYFDVREGMMRYFGRVTYKLVDTRNVSFSKNFLKQEDLDKVVININGETFVTKPKFLELDFEASGRKGHIVYGMGKKIVLVYVQYFDGYSDKIKVLGSIDNGEYYEEDNHRTYDISVDREKYRRELDVILRLFHCNGRNCKIKSDIEGNKYFYKHGKLVGRVLNFGDKKIVIKKEYRREKVVAVIIQEGNKELIIGVGRNFGRNLRYFQQRKLKDFLENGTILAEFPGYKVLDVKLKQINAHMKLKIK